MTHTHIDLEAESMEQMQQYVEEFPTRAYEHAYEQGWTDGLPIIPASVENVQRFVAASGRAADELLGIMPPRKGRVTIEAIAVNAIMAGCRPEYMPVIIAVTEGLLDPEFRLEHMQVTTNGHTPFILVNGPARKKLEINCGVGCLGPGWRANATIGRAVRLILNNVGGGLPGVYSKSVFSSPLRYSFMCGENEEANPWTPYHVDRGFKQEQSTVTVFFVANFCNIASSYSANPEVILRHLATYMLPMHGTDGDSALLLLGVNTAQALHEAGLTKRDIQQRLSKLARLPASYFSEALIKEKTEYGRIDENNMMWRSPPDNFYIICAGGAGPWDIYVAGGEPQTREIRGM